MGKNGPKVDNGPIIVEDYHLIENLPQFDRERIPESVVYARGANAKGFFEVTHDVFSMLITLFMLGSGGSRTGSGSSP
ncbi:catalase-like isoform X2 [Miscanthus floridulus]|uniref:catalase-like isoform X2 n=1 Tax=Miscanthus floridulus TaxID=154761 RepID=UPI0034576B58